jgi:hypothetical protein
VAIRSAALACAQDEVGSVLLETALGVAIILAAALPFGSLITYATRTAADLSATQGAARESARTRAVPTSDVGLTCGATVDAADGPCVAPLAHGSYVKAAKDTLVMLPFGLSLHTDAKAVARVD